MFSDIFNADNPFFKPFGKLVDVVCLSVLWFVCSLPIVTLGPATAALYDSTARCVRGDQNGPYARFFRAFRENFKTGALAGLIVAAAVAGMAFLYRFIYARASVGERGLWYALYYSWWVIAVVLSGLLSYLLPVLSRFEFKLGGLVRTSLRLGMAHLPSTFLLGAVTLTCGLFNLTHWYVLFFFPCLCTLVCTLPLERIFRPYMGEPEEPPADEEEGG